MGNSDHGTTHTYTAPRVDSQGNANSFMLAGANGEYGAGECGDARSPLYLGFGSCADPLPSHIPTSSESSQ